MQIRMSNSFGGVPARLGKGERLEAQFDPEILDLVASVPQSQIIRYRVFVGVPSIGSYRLS